MSPVINQKCDLKENWSFFPYQRPFTYSSKSSTLSKRNVNQCFVWKRTGRKMNPGCLHNGLTRWFNVKHC